jgi:hypothetical protein
MPPTRDLPEKVAAVVEREEPVAAILGFSSSYFVYESVLARVRRRSPFLYEAARPWVARLKDASGPGLAGGSSARGLLFRAPHAIAERLIGAEPFMKLEHAIANARGAMLWLGTHPGLTVLCKLAYLSPTVPAERLATYGARLAAFNEGIIAACDETGIFYYDLKEATAAAGLAFGTTPDGLHADLPSRRFEAAMIAGRILEAAGIDGKAATSPGAYTPA